MVFALKFISGRYRGGEIVLPEEGELFIGRSTELDLVLSEDMVSRKHARLCVTAGTLAISDLGSTNGTFVNGEKVEHAALRLHDRVLIGTSILKVIDISELKTGSAERQNVKDMMQRLADRPSDSSTMSGELTEVPLPDLLQLFATNQKSGVLTLSGVLRGKIYLHAGQILSAVVETSTPLSPMKAFCRMLTLSEGVFVMEAFTGDLEIEAQLEGTTESILIEALRQLDEFQRIAGQLPAPVAKLSLEVPLVPKLSALSQEELEVLQLIINTGGVAATIDLYPGTDFTAYLHLHRLIAEGYVEVV